MKALNNLLEAMSKSAEYVDPKVLELLMVSEHEEFFVVLSWDNADNHYLVNRFFKDTLGWGMTHTDTTSYNAAVKIFCKLIVKD